GVRPPTLPMPNHHSAVFADDEPLGRELKSSGKSSVLTGHMATLASKFGTSTVWGAVASNDPSFKSDFNAGLSGALAGNPAMKGIADAMQSAKGFAFAA